MKQKQSWKEFYGRELSSYIPLEHLNSERTEINNGYRYRKTSNIIYKALETKIQEWVEKLVERLPMPSQEEQEETGIYVCSRCHGVGGIRLNPEYIKLVLYKKNIMKYNCENFWKFENGGEADLDPKILQTRSSFRVGFLSYNLAELDKLGRCCFLLLIRDIAKDVKKCLNKEESKPIWNNRAFVTKSLKSRFEKIDVLEQCKKCSGLGTMDWIQKIHAAAA